MPYKNIEDRRKNSSEYREKNREKIRKNHKEWRENNKEKIDKYYKKYYYSEHGKKNETIKCWRLRGIIDEDLSAVYYYYIKQTHCMICLTEFINSQNRHLDHDHRTGEIRYICCANCNVNFMREKYIS